MDNCGSHGKDLVDIREQVTIFTLPPNCTSVHLPMDMGGISAWKSRYRHTLLRDMIVTMETREQRKRMAITNKLKAGMRGLSEGHDPYMLDVSELVACTWKQVSERTISRCWIKADILPVGVTAYLVNLHGKVSRNECQIEKEIVDEVLQMLRRLQIGVDSRFTGTQSLDRKEVEQWVNIESDEDMVEASVNDASDFLNTTQLVRNPPETQSSDEDESAGDTIGRSVIPSALEIAELFGDLELLASEYQVADALSHLWSARRAFLTAKHDRKPTPIRQMIISECL